MLLRSTPIRTLSLANSKSFNSTVVSLRLAAKSAASLTRFSRSAPEKPGVPREMTARSTSWESGTFFVWTLRISARPRTSGRSTVICRSKRPGLSRAGSSTSGRLVAAIRMTPSVGFDTTEGVIRPIGSGDQDDPLGRIEAVHLDQELVERLLALIMAAPQASTAQPADGVDLIDEDDARGVLLAL